MIDFALRGIFDSHAHYYDERFEREAEGGAKAILKEIMPRPVNWILNVGTNCENSGRAIEQAAKYEGMYAAVGIHPGDCHYLPYPEQSLEELAELLGSPESRAENKIVALGEIGLDYHFDFYGDIPMNKEKQMFFFQRQMEMAQYIELPVIVHDREAHGDCFETVLRYAGVRGVFHSYSGSAEMARELVRRGWYISFSGTLTFKNAAKVREAALAVPRDRLLIETDAPYLAPHPMRGKLNHSGLLTHTVTALAELWGCTPQQAADQTAENVQSGESPDGDTDGQALSGYQAHSDGGGKHAKADDVAERVDLNTEALLLIGALFAGAGDLAVEHIADARGQQATEGIEGLAGGGQVYTQDMSRLTYVRITV